MVFPTITGKAQIIRKQKRGITYVYERIPYYGSSIKNTKYHYRYIGKDTGGVIGKVRSVLPKRSLMG